MRFRGLIALALILISSIACGNSTPTSDTLNINVGLQNSWTDTLNVEIFGGSGGTVSRDIPPGYTSIVVTGSSPRPLQFNAQGLQPGGPIGGGICTSTEAITGSGADGQVTFTVSGDQVFVECTTGWLESIIP